MVLSSLRHQLHLALFSFCLGRGAQEHRIIPSRSPTVITLIWIWGEVLWLSAFKPVHPRDLQVKAITIQETPKSNQTWFDLGGLKQTTNLCPDLSNFVLNFHQGK
ncbi:hypothetical protein GUJ93_ZPchr0002g25301 [Zizania palustris]|uniref:Uncharacterized protein n=1 Tax=Zizania palustris TaxID=103762 RepID=A0A8J5S655_ZIZPA|nr:hypothetical protein GUJ93_ZPchr0002g25301 [Zizania palustris]